ncbi:MAG: hypothetical protein VYC52_07265, partial [Pseudomonadota bacterium]|nr:hypothetical protein [Pseudomonadota bacterium]
TAQMNIFALVQLLRVPSYDCVRVKGYHSSLADRHLGHGNLDLLHQNTSPTDGGLVLPTDA